MKIYITNNTDESISNKIRGIIKSAINATVAEIMPDKSFEISVMLTNNKEIHELNLLHRNVDKPTDVLSFPMWEDGDFDVCSGENAPLGDIVISMEQASAQAESYAHSLEREIGFLTVHSMLHLFGFDHETSEDDEAEMFALQDKILKNIDLVR